MQIQDIGVAFISKKIYNINDTVFTDKSRVMQDTAAMVNAAAEDRIFI